MASGRPPAAIAVVRISGPLAIQAAAALSDGALPPPRRAALRALHDPESGGLLDRALVLLLPGPGSPTGENVAELHLHGGRATVDAVLGALGRLPGLAPAGPGAFTRRAFDNNVLDLTQVEGLADLLSAETEVERMRALDHAEGSISARAARWREALLTLSAEVEADLDFSDEADISALDVGRVWARAAAVADDMRTLLYGPRTDRLREGVRVAFLGPPNVGKSSLVNYLSGRAVAIVTDIPGTTRDIIEVPLTIEGLPFLLLDMAGDRDTADPIEAEGVRRTRAAAAAADIVIAFPGAAMTYGPHVVAVAAKADLGELVSEPDRLAVSSVTGEGCNTLLRRLHDIGRGLIDTGAVGLANARQVDAVAAAAEALDRIEGIDESELVADELREALHAIGRLTGQVDVEAMLDVLFGRFCIGK